MKLMHADRPAMLKTQAASGPQTLGDMCTRRLRKAAPADGSSLFAGIGGIDPAGFRKALDAVSHAQTKPRTMIPGYTGTAR